ncbi:Holliday junction ATP-dependent DNA helicase RuvA (EC 3.6.4.12) [uncultured Gammaproteobacteria bacterium]|jgi:Holliday junction DNA helicase RuvA|uniref:Holliday junction branch migration protein RuvA n=1 Tax=thiotrophic endosymbiont of Bathymodiolus puteoserpentis (Logatchev) TaxID=343240 RepID=UPI0010B99B8E|nr:Holliday junction branch migration protein RuvA [thiotrophic endosymbiont of Bathymodiolus puteoserpentis (Logatchev)]CAC9499125.1 Holliday junction DNA helicase RuvA [uncultured Gammaproteobacteria bacterium]CAC9507931.1 Holliday junction DNA helicase RuvA [uncultured Gammaproteobacteria bacterium]CAC9590720.1 Holliday junction ATP-dependent DNA helicase RuvA (EC 3.6.4.12) [uncultured Gammaproteobacteria bacterium]CAC9637878.1 Holliday junction ATP-dependent DNA helicase RuvA (EC 3.6.4.12) 
MIGQLTGKILEKNPPEVLLEVGGIGYEVLCPMPTFYAMENRGELTLHTHFHVKEDAQTLYGFISKDEKTIFRELIRVNGVGPKVALSILSHLDIATLMSAVANDDDALLAKTPGIGKKTAQKLIVELKDRLTKLELTDTNHQTVALSNSNPNTGKALSALQALGFKVKEAEKMLSAITDNSLSTEQLIRLALQNK